MDVELKQTVQTALRRVDLWRYVNEAASQFLNPGHFFCHIVLNDASQQEQVTTQMHELERQLSSSRNRFEWIVRSLWTISSVEYTGQCYNEEGIPLTATCFTAMLHSGSREQRIEVAVTETARRELLKHISSDIKDYAAHNRYVTEMVRSYLQLLLAQKGLQYWDPLQESERKIFDIDSLSWVLHEQRQ